MLKLPRLIGEGCVLQQGKAVRIWGFDTPKEKVSVSLQGQERTGVTDASGRWEVWMENLKAGGPFAMKAENDKGESVLLSEVYVGEVWLCAGQSNMELPMERVLDRYPEERTAEQTPWLRLFGIPEDYRFDAPLADHRAGEWKECTAENLPGLSALCYFYGKELQKARRVPVGIINASKGGSRIEAWMGRNALKEYPALLAEADGLLEEGAPERFLTEQESEMQQWLQALVMEDDKNRLSEAENETGWKEITLPGYLEEAGLPDFCGKLLLRRKILLPESAAGKPASLWLGTLVDSDETFLNGVKVGETGYQYPPRKYPVPAGLLKPGKNEVTILLTCNDGKGRMTPGKDYRLFGDGFEAALSGNWQYRVLCESGRAPEMDFLCRKATGLYHALIAPCLPYTIQGVLWYQGESNDRRPEDYEDLLRRLIRSYREGFGEELPFIIVQLPGFAIDLPQISGWPKIREAQSAVQTLPHVAVTVNLDLGEENDLHPLNKKDVAHRAALAARQLVYGEAVCGGGPILKESFAEGSVMCLVWDTGDGGPLLTKDGRAPEAFYLAGGDRKFYRAQCRLEGNRTYLESEKVPCPEFVRYAFSNAPSGGLLCNESGLLAAPFRTDKNFGQRLFNDGWEFAKLPLFTELSELEDSKGAFHPVALPHDWLIYQADRLYEDGTGWYRRAFYWEQEEDLCAALRFEGIYMDSTVYVNRKEAARWKYGYSTFEADMTPWLKKGWNEILVRVDFQAPNSRWYSGAGIYRDVWLKLFHAAARLESDGTYVTARERENGLWELEAQTQVYVRKEGDAVCPGLLAAEYRLMDLETGRPVSFADGKDVVRLAISAEEGKSAVVLRESVKDPVLWDVKRPYRYRLTVCLKADGKLWQEEEYTVGFRSISFSPEQGFLLNHRKVKLNGVCEHHDLGCLGAAYHSAAMRRKLLTLQKMGVNALRLTHNMPAPDVMELADELGFLVVSEAFDMWERSKTPYDYARFFPDWYQKDVESWVKRDRNHPSLILWSIGNEILDTHADEKGQEWTRRLRDAVLLHDPKGNGAITIGSNYMPWENARKCADILGIAGYNYGERYYDRHHQEHPDWIIYGSETASTVQSRGIYHFPYEQAVLADVDEQCSALGNSTTSWGAASSESCIIAERDHSFSCGQFLWTGFDYIGEPTPYHTRNSYFGQVDTAGFPKDSYYIYQAEWTDDKEEPMVHVFPYWDFNEGQIIDVRVCSNAPKVELFFNRESLGSFAIDHQNGTQLAGHWKVPYAPGELTACAYDEAGREIARESRKSFREAVKLSLHADKKRIKGDGRDLAFVEIGALDSDGNPVENAANEITVRVSGAGYLAGLDNGDSTDTDAYKTDTRRLFSGKLLAVVAAAARAGKIYITACSKGLEPAQTVILAEEAPVCEGIGEGAGGLLPENGNARTETGAETKRQETIPVRAIRLSSKEGTRLSDRLPKAHVSAKLCPANASDREVSWCVVNDAGIESPLVAIEACGTEAVLTARSDGKFRLRCMSGSGTEKIRILSELEFEITGMGKAWLDPYGFIAGGLYDYSSGNVGNGNEHGVATARDGESRVGFHGIDFGAFGSDEIVLPIFALTDDAYPIQIWEGMPDEEGSSLAGEIVYQKKSIWNVYQEETFRLDRRLKGVTNLCFVTRQKLHLKGFSFKRQQKAWQKLQAIECSSVYGDSFERTQEGIEGIGNNVTIRFANMDFGEDRAVGIRICGYTPLERNAIQIRFETPEGEQVRLVEFCHEDRISEQTFALEGLQGSGTVSFVFLPGCRFDFRWFCFLKE